MVIRYDEPVGNWLEVSDRIVLGPVTDSLFRLLLVVFLIAINGFFAGAEVALLSVRHSRLRQMAEEGQAGAQAALNLLSNPGRLLSVTQVGVTLASLGLGMGGRRHALPDSGGRAASSDYPGYRRSCCTARAW